MDFLRSNRTFHFFLFCFCPAQMPSQFGLMIFSSFPSGPPYLQVFLPPFLRLSFEEFPLGFNFRQRVPNFYFDSREPSAQIACPFFQLPNLHPSASPLAVPRVQHSCLFHHQTRFWPILPLDAPDTHHPIQSPRHFSFFKSPVDKSKNRSPNPSKAGRLTLFPPVSSVLADSPVKETTFPYYLTFFSRT